MSVVGAATTGNSWRITSILAMRESSPRAFWIVTSLTLHSLIISMSRKSFRRNFPSCSTSSTLAHARQLATAYAKKLMTAPVPDERDSYWRSDLTAVIARSYVSIAKYLDAKDAKTNTAVVYKDLVMPRPIAKNPTNSAPLRNRSGLSRRCHRWMWTRTPERNWLSGFAKWRRNSKARCPLSTRRRRSERHRRSPSSRRVVSRQPSMLSGSTCPSVQSLDFRELCEVLHCLERPCNEGGCCSDYRDNRSRMSPGVGQRCLPAA